MCALAATRCAASQLPQAVAAYVPEEPPKDTVVKKKRKAPAGRMVTSSKGAKLPF